MANSGDKVEAREEEEEEKRVVKLGSYKGKVRTISDSDSDAAAEETLLLWGLQQPASATPNALVAQSSHGLRIDACGRDITVIQSPSSLGAPGVTGSVVWDSAVVLAKFLEHSVDSDLLAMAGKKVVEIGSGCGLVGCVAALLGGQVTLTDLPDRMRLLKKNVEVNLGHGNIRGSATVTELIWGDDPERQLIDPLPDFGSDVVYSEGAVAELLITLKQLSGPKTTIFLAGELRNDAILEYFLEAATEDFLIGRVDQEQWHPDFCSPRVVLYVIVKKQLMGEPERFLM